jgi:tetratricopeptide (TPR) repeat protein
MIRFTRDWDIEGADRDLRRALAINPSLAQAHHYRSSVLTAAGRMDEAIRAAQRARELDPLSSTVNATLGIRYYYAGRYADAREQLRNVTDVSPQFGVPYWGLAAVANAERRPEDAVANMRRAVELSGPSSYMRAWLGFFLGRAGRRAEAELVLAALEHERRTTYVSPFHLALVTLGLGRDDDAIDWLELAYEDGSGWMMFLRAQPEFAPLAGNPRFERLLSRVTARPRGSARDTHWRRPTTPARRRCATPPRQHAPADRRAAESPAQSVRRSHRRADRGARPFPAPGIRRASAVCRR